jgi:hypothetical protein|tara:strand:+ start:128 stop:307 length:180 start_codon:yes stop_codon:yes gene_type:complete
MMAQHSWSLITETGAASWAPKKLLVDTSMLKAVFFYFISTAMNCPWQRPQTWVFWLVRS